ncbi:uncharacterized protein LOC126633923 [Malus sylvestris]|uniref:uncharacterized protein LOC126633923 n=1 Tax=Malus sylvestris TaxID=3752 RepID=UPI0021AC4EC6|nr:uncharacterized protein LOC126633923 [Malus sylvestris]
MGSTGSDVFTEIGFTNWKKGPKNLRVHEGGVGSLHNKAVQQARDLMTQKQYIETFVIKQTDEAHINYRTLLSASFECTRWLLGQGLPFRGHDESLKSSNRGNYLELMQFLSKHNEQVRKVVFENAPKNLKYTSSDIQKDLVRACAIETVSAITKDMEGEAIEKFLGVQHVSSITSSSLEDAIERLFATTNLSMSKLRGQGYDGASNMKALVFVAKENEDVANFFINASSLVNLIGSSCKRRDAFREKQQEQIQKAHDLAVVEVVEWIKSDRNQDNLEKFCEEHDIIVPNMEDLHFVPGKSRRKAQKITNFHHYRVDLYFQVLDMQLKELNDGFNEVNTELLLCMACLSPVNNFASFDKAKIVRLAQLYSQDFDRMDLMNLPIQLDNYIHDMKMHSEFSSLRGLSDLAQELVKTGRCESYMLVYKLLTLALVLPVATALVERAFSAMKIFAPLPEKSWLRHCIHTHTLKQ